MDGLDPHPLFKTKYYLINNPDVKAAGINPLVHFMNFGVYEGRNPCPSVSGNLLKSLVPIHGDICWESLIKKIGVTSYTLNDVLTSQNVKLPDIKLFNKYLRQVKSASDLKIISDEIKSLSENYTSTNKLDVSIIIPVHNKLSYTLNCIHSVLKASTKYRFEIIVANDASTDKTKKVLFDLKSPMIRCINQTKKIGFLKNCNAASLHAKGKWLVLLNNDTIALPGWLDALIDTFKSVPNAGLVGSRLLNPDGSLQECGGKIFLHGDGLNIGRGQDPRHPCFNFLREVDYCSAASIALPLKIWKKLRGFDVSFSPAYYEDTDLAFRMRDIGLKTFVQPFSNVIHFEGISNGKSLSKGIKKYQKKNKDVFLSKWKKVLEVSNCENNKKESSFLFIQKKTILVIDAETPRPDRDSGSCDTIQYLKLLLKLRYHVIFASQNCLSLGSYTETLQKMGVECIYSPYVNSLEEAIERVINRVDLVLVFRYYVAAELFLALKKFKPGIKVILATVDLHFLREYRKAEVTGQPRDFLVAKKIKLKELRAIKSADASIVLNRQEKELLNNIAPKADVHEIPLFRDIPKLKFSPLDNRNTILFIGGFNHPPNLDGISWFLDKVWPILEKKGFPGNLVIIGSDIPASIQKLDSKKIKVLGYVKDLSSHYANCRVSIAPLRYGAGLKGKIITSISYGVPCISTSIGAEGFGLQHNKNILIADKPMAMANQILRLFNKPTLWEKIAKNGLDFFVNNYTESAALPKVKSLIENLGIHS